MSSSKIRRGNIPEEEFARLVVAPEMPAIPLYIDNTGGLSICQLAARARRLKRQKGLDLLVIDYIQLLQGSSRKGTRTACRKSPRSRPLKALAKELNVPIIGLSQLSREVESATTSTRSSPTSANRARSSRTPTSSCSSFARSTTSRTKSPRKAPRIFKWQAEMEKVHGRAEMIIGKQRHGPTGTVEVSFEAEFTRFGNLARRPSAGAHVSGPAAEAGRSSAALVPVSRAPVEGVQPAGASH